jgi:hypothetical protein
MIGVLPNVNSTLVNTQLNQVEPRDWELARCSIEVLVWVYYVHSTQEIRFDPFNRN